MEEQRRLNEDFKAELRARDNQRYAELQDLRNEMRDRDNQRHAEIMKLDQKFDERMTAMDKKFDERTTAMDKRFDELTKHVQTLVSTTAVGVGGVAVALIVYLLTR